MTPKEEKYLKFAEATLKLIFHSGEEALSHSQVARAAGVSRAWVYKYIGRDRTDIIEFAVDYFGKLYSGLETPFEKMNRNNWREVLLQRTHDFLSRTQKNRWIVPLYYRFKGTDSTFGRRLDRIESAYLQKLEAELLPILGKKEGARVKAVCEVLTALRLGLAFRISGYRSRTATGIDELVEVLGRWLAAK